jgi:ketosteroid isomerase-like protein
MTEMVFKSERDHIAELAHAYADAVARRDATGWGATWATDARWVLGADRNVVGREAIVALWLTSMAKYRVVIQRVLNGHVDFAGDGMHASGRWHIQEHFRRADGVAGILLAHYDDTYVKVEGTWLFASRALVRYYGGPPDLSIPFENEVEL